MTTTTNDAAAIDGSRKSLNHVLREEVQALGFKVLDDLKPTDFDTDAGDDDSVRANNLREIYQRLAGIKLSALCLSGGGIRSATFNLGVIQALARCGLLQHFHYLSSVSGGGYIASWLRTWMRREGSQRVIDELKNRVVENPLNPEPTQVKQLRAYSNYLTPKLGLFSADTWSAVALVLRNLLLNWLVILPLLGAVVAVPQVLLLVARSTDFGHAWGCWLLGIALLFELTASILLYAFRRFKKAPGTSQSVFVIFCVIPIWLAAEVLAGAGLGLNLPWKEPDPDPTAIDETLLYVFAAVWCIAIPLIGWSISELFAKFKARAMGERERRVSYLWELLGLVVSGIVASVLLVVMIEQWLGYLQDHAAWYVIASVPLLLAIYFIARTLFVAIAALGEGKVERKSLGAQDAVPPNNTSRDSGPHDVERRGNSPDADREWWARLTGWVMIVAFVWVLVCGLSLLGGHLPSEREQFGGWLRGMLAGLGGVSGLVAAFLGHAEDTPGPAARPQQTSTLKKWILALAAPLFVLCVFLLIGWGTGYLAEQATGVPQILSLRTNAPAGSQPITVAMSLRALIVPAGLLILMAIAASIVNVNRFSLHGMYRNRLMRAYLGASNAARKPDPFTGFDLRDNVSLHELWKAPDAQKPLPIINTTLNLVGGDDLAWQQRKAESFSMTPFYCGNHCEGYRSSKLYGGPEGISVGTAVTISGAAANPNMGFASSPVIGFLLALFNARLGAWLGNTNKCGERTYRRSGPRFALMSLVEELLGLTNRSGAYVNLSDGGHFDNLGLYEVVLRRCRHIMVCDAGQDKSFAFDDLGNAIRKIRVDFGIPIEFRHRILIRARDAEPLSKEPQGLYCAIADICYSVVDSNANGTPIPNGVLIYIKPTLHGWARDQRQLPYDVYSYSQNQPDFPHEPTTDQWFSESQFESYRKLGEATIEDITRARGQPGDNKKKDPCAIDDASTPSFEEFLLAVTNYIQDAQTELKLM